MSYSRFGADGSSVYVYLDVGGYLRCCGCPLQDREWVDDDTYPILGGYLKRVGEIVPEEHYTTADMLAHLDRHRAAGHTIPQSLIDGLLEDQTENDAQIAAERHGAISTGGTRIVDHT